MGLIKSVREGQESKEVPFTLCADRENRSRVTKLVSLAKCSRPRLSVAKATYSGLRFSTKAKKFAFSTTTEIENY